MNTIAILSGYLGALAFGALAALLAVSARERALGRVLLAGAAVSAVWCWLHAVYQQVGASGALSGILTLDVLQYGELARDTLWVAFLAKLLAPVGDETYRRRVRFGLVVLGALVIAAGVLIAAPPALVDSIGLTREAQRKLYLSTSLLIALGGIVLVEQVFRNTTRDARWALKHLCFGIGFLFAYDFYLYADAVLFNRLDLAVWSVRTGMNALAVPLIAISAARNREWDLKIFVSRRVVFHGVALAGAGLYLVAMAAAGYYLRLVGGAWGQALTTAFIGAALLLLLTLFLSVQLRSRLRLFLAKHFYRNKYEYGEEWLKFTVALSHAALDPESLNRTILGAVCDIVDSPGGVVWRRMPEGHFAVAGTLALYETCRHEIGAAEPLVAALESRAAVLDLGDDDLMESEQAPVLPAWLPTLPRLELLVPIVYRDELLAVLGLARPRSGQRLDLEDLDLLATVGRQAASYLALVRATDALSEARQFETFNRLSAFLVHDLKNVVAQLSLIVSNARRHRGNPEFVDDAFNTVADAAAKISRMLVNLRQMQAEVPHDELVELRALCAEAVRRMTDASPLPRLREGEHPVHVLASHDRLLSVVQHLLQNAVEATDADGAVEITVAERDQQAWLTIADSGCGMDRDFVNNRLFKPFDTTKGKAGMGIGAYESRHVISSMGGELRVASEPGVGTTFTIVLPLAAAAEPRAAADDA